MHICRIESGGSLPSFSLFLKICNVLGTSADYLLGDLLDRSVEQLGKQFKHLMPEQIEMISEMVEVNDQKAHHHKRNNGSKRIRVSL